jgi:tRNA A-37 threonylcarbamoyl transferase component Bud32
MNSLLANDPALPQRDVLVDEAVMAQYLSRLLTRYGDFGITKCERLRTKYRVGGGLRVLYEVSGGGHVYRVAARAFPRSQQISNRFTSTPEIYAPELNTSFWIFPHDRKIKNLVALIGIPEELRDIEGREWVESRIVGHVPEKSVTAKCLDHKQQIIAYAKIYAGEEGREVYDAYNEIHAALESGVVQLRIPRALAYHEKHRLLLLESVPGVPLSALRPADREYAYRRLGEALQKLHSITPPSPVSRSTRLTPSGLMQAAATISVARPEVSALAQQLAGKLIACHKEFCDAPPVLLHGDLHPKNALMDDERLFLLDLDQAATGPAALDLGSVIAGLYCEACVTDDDCSSLINAFLTGYGVAEETLRWYVAAALLEERALRAVTRIRFGGLQKLPEILTTAEAVLNGGISAH